MCAYVRVTMQVMDMRLTGWSDTKSALLIDRHANNTTRTYQNDMQRHESQCNACHAMDQCCESSSGVTAVTVTAVHHVCHCTIHCSSTHHHKQRTPVWCLCMYACVLIST